MERRSGGAGRRESEGATLEDRAQVEAGIRYWHRCTVQAIAPGGDTAALKLFGSVMEHAGRYKLVSYANDF